MSGSGSTFHFQSNRRRGRSGDLEEIGPIGPITTAGPVGPAGAVTSAAAGRPIAVDSGSSFLAERLAAVHEQLGALLRGEGRSSAALAQPLKELHEELTGLAAVQAVSLKEQALLREEQSTLGSKIVLLAGAVERLTDRVEGLGRGNLPVLVTSTGPLLKGTATRAWAAEAAKADQQVVVPMGAEREGGSGIVMQPVRPRLQLGEPEPADGEVVLHLDSR
jgi:hypothetical protein